MNNAPKSRRRSSPRQPQSQPPRRPAQLALAAGSQPAGEAAQAELDIVGDILRRISELVPAVDLDALADVEAAVRHDWGGDRAYVTKRGESHQARMSKRDEAIRDQHQRGESVPLLSRRWGVSERRIRQIVGG